MTRYDRNHEYKHKIPSSLLIAFLLNIHPVTGPRLLLARLGFGLHQSVEAGQLGLEAGDLGSDKDTRGRVVRPEAEADLALPMSMSARTQQHHTSTNCSNNT